MSRFVCGHVLTGARAVAIACGLLWGTSHAAGAANDPAARFRGTRTGDVAVTNVHWQAATKDHGYVTFDLSWSDSWRATWTEPAERNVRGKPLEVENWDAAWVFVKFLSEKDSPKSIERNHWQHATLSVDASDHVMPTGATNDVGRTDDGRRGVGVFIYRDAIGHGRNEFKGVKLRWLHGADKVNPARAAVKVHALAMVYVPQGAFKAGSGIRVPIGRFPDGPKRPVVGGPLPGKTPDWPRGCFGAFADGSWRGGRPTTPFLVDAEWSGPVAKGSRARRIGPRAGQLWGNLVFDFHNRGLSCGFGSMAPVADTYPPATLHNDFPTGCDAFYCMKYPLTQGQYATFLNSLPPDVAAKRGFVSGDGKMPNSFVTTAFIVVEKRKISPGPGFRPYTIEEWDGHTITCSNDKVPKIPISLDAKAGEDDDILDGLVKDTIGKGEDRKKENKPKRPPVFTARMPDRPCGWIGWVDGFAYAIWAGLRPMTELEYEKARRGPLDPLRTRRAAGTKHAKTAADRAREALGATYWGGRGLGGTPITVGAPLGRAFRGTHGDGRTPAGAPGGSLKRSGYRYDPAADFDTAPADWPRGVEGGKEGVGGRAYIGRRPQRLPRTRFGCGRTAPAAHKPRPMKPPPPPRTAAKTDTAGGGLPVEAPPADAVKLTDVRWAAGTKDYSFVTFDLAWNGSWRAVWTEPAAKNVTGKPMKIENWDAAWVFVKFRRTGAAGASHATLASDSADHQVPAGAALDVGLNNDGDKGLGVFIYRDAVGRGDNSFRNVKLRWLHGADGADPGKVKLAVHAIAMVYVAEGPFKSKSPLRQPIITERKQRPWAPRLPLTLIRTADATQQGGYYPHAGQHVPEHRDWANGYRAFYCMKRSISQGQYAAFLSSVPADLNAPGNNAERYFHGAVASETPRRYNARLYRLCGYTIKTDAPGAYRADAPHRPCNFLSWPDIQSYSAWAALRPPTALEYEKACRGPREFAQEEDAWAEGTCAPAAGLPAPGAPGASYWGIRQLSLSGCSHEWPGTVGNGVNREGLEFKATHGNGTPTSPADWPKTTAFGDWFTMSWEAGGASLGFCSIGIWVLPSQMGRVRENWYILDADRTGRYGARAVRTAPFRADPNSPLRVDRLPDLRGYDIGVFYLSGRFRNDGSKPLKVELASPLPDACFPRGPASRAFTVRPNTTTPFKIVTVLTRSALAALARNGRTLPVRIEGAGGQVLGGSVLRLPPGDFEAPAAKVIGSLDGGEVSLRILNATDRPRRVKIDMPSPPGLKLAKNHLRIELSASAEARATFPVPRQASGADRLCRLPYRVALAGGAAQRGETAADLRVTSRWWITRRVRAEPKLDTGERDGDLNIGDIVCLAGDIFKNDAPPRGWKRATCGAAIPLHRLGPLPSSGSSVLAATRMLSPGHRPAVLHVRHQQRPRQKARLVILVWLNDKVVYDSRAGASARPRPKPKPFRLRKGVNTMIVECRSAQDAPATGGDVFLQFHDAKDGRRLDALMFDIDQRGRKD